MVFIEVKSKYIEDVILSTPGLSNIISFLFEDQEKCKLIISGGSNDLGKLTEAVDQLIATLIGGNEDLFNKFCIEYERKNPDESSSWINNNYLIYLMITGSFLFDRDVDWLKPVLELRRAESGEARLSKEILLAAITKQINTRLSGFLLSFFWLTNHSERFEQHISSARAELINLSYFPKYSDEFLNLLQLHSFTAVMLSSSVINQDYTQNISIFKRSLESKIAKAATALSIIVVNGVLVICYLTLKKVFAVVPQSTKDWILIFLSLLGFTGMEVLKGRKSISRFIVNRLNKTFQIDKLKDAS